MLQFNQSLAITVVFEIALLRPLIQKIMGLNKLAFIQFFEITTLFLYGQYGILILGFLLLPFAL